MGLILTGPLGSSRRNDDIDIEALKLEELVLREHPRGTRKSKAMEEASGSRLTSAVPFGA